MTWGCAPRRGRVDLPDAALVGAGILTFVLVAALPFGPKRLGDLDYHAEAMALSLALKGAVAWGETAITKAPGGVLWYIAPYLGVHAGSSDEEYWRAGVAWSAGAMILSVLLVRRAAESLGGRRAGIAAALLTLVSPFSAYYALGIMAEPPAYFATSVLLFGWTSWWSRSGRSWVAASVAAAGFAFFLLNRPTSVLLLAIGMVVAAWLAWRRARREALLLGACVLLACASTGAASLVARSLEGRANAQRQLPYLAYVAFHGRFQYREEPFDWRFWGSSTRQGSADYARWRADLERISAEAVRTGVPEHRLQLDWITRDILHHPLLSLRIAAVRLLTLHLAFVNSRGPGAFALGPVPGPLVYWVFHGVVNAVTAGLLAGSVLFLWRRRRSWTSLWPLWAPWLALLAFHALIYAEPRYLFPVRPAWAVMAAVACFGGSTSEAA